MIITTNSTTPKFTLYRSKNFFKKGKCLHFQATDFSLRPKKGFEAVRKKPGAHINLFFFPNRETADFFIEGRTYDQSGYTSYSIEQFPHYTAVIFTNCKSDENEINTHTYIKHPCMEKNTEQKDIIARITAPSATVTTIERRIKYMLHTIHNGAASTKSYNTRKEATNEARNTPGCHQLTKLTTYRQDTISPPAPNLKKYTTSVKTLKI
jgi:hypothetical protein